MAKMFYTIEEAAERLGVSAEQVKQLATGGKLQQFRDRDKLMFKREQVDALALKAGTAGGSGPVTLAGSGDTDTGPAKGDSHHGQRKEDPRQATGISVFDADEITPADPLSQTQVTQPMGRRRPGVGKCRLRQWLAGPDARERRHKSRSRTA